MLRPSLNDVQKKNKTVDIEECAPLHISVLRNITVEPILPYYQYQAYSMQLNPIVKWGQYDQIIPESVGGAPHLLNSHNDCVILFSHLDGLSVKLSREFSDMTPTEIGEETHRLEEYFDAVLTGIRGQTAAMILWHGFECPVTPALGIFDDQSESGQSAVIRSLNARLSQALAKRSNAYFVDVNTCLAATGLDDYYDERYWHIGRAPYTSSALYEIAKKDFRFIRALKGQNKKCLVLDCDNTLWGGVVGEDGISGIQLSKSYPGSIFYEFQQEILNLHKRGVILCLCSKNNDKEVWDVFNNHPDMVLKREHVAAARINWLDKATNIRGLAEELNIGLDSMVFIDDSDFEINLIRENVSEVLTIHVPVEQSLNNRSRLLDCAVFDTLTLSEEDQNRGEMYRAEVERKTLKSTTTDLKLYYQSLDMELIIELADEFSIRRIAQLTQKTNQFNFTTQRYTDEDIKAFQNSDESDVFYLRLNDRFGDSGIVGVIILKYHNNVAEIDTFLQSCRILGRGCEEAFLSQILKWAKLKGCHQAIGRYIPTRKNIQVRDFYLKQGFISTPEGEGAYQFNLDGVIPPEPEFFKTIDGCVIEQGDSLV